MALAILSCKVGKEVGVGYWLFSRSCFGVFWPHCWCRCSISDMTTDASVWVVAGLFAVDISSGVTLRGIIK